MLGGVLLSYSPKYGFSYIQSRQGLSRHLSARSLQLEPLAGVWKDSLQRPVEMSQIFTTPSESLEMAIPSVDCRLTDLIEAEASGVDSESAATGSVGKAPVCQNLIDLSWDEEIREEENTREVMRSVCPMKVSTRQGSDLVISQM